MASLIRFEAFELDLEAGELRKHGVKIKLADQPFSILASLLNRPGEVVTREELQRKLWAADTFVDFDRGLNKAMNRLRDTLGDSANAPRFVETLPKRGYRFIGRVEDDLAGPDSLAGSQIEQPSPVEPRRGRIGWKYLAAAAGLLFVVAGLAFIGSRRSAESEQLLRSSLLPPPNTFFLPYNFALSPDGTHLAFVAVGSGKNLLWIRALSAVDAYPLNDTDGASFPFWAPDNRHVGFFADRKLKTVDIAGGPIRILSDTKRPSGGTWSANGLIVFAPDVNGPLYRVPATGGTLALVTSLSREGEAHRWPFFLPDGKHFLYTADNVYSVEQGTGIFAGSTESNVSESNTPVPISPERVRNAVFALNRVFFSKGGTLSAQWFEPGRLKLIGEPVPVFQREVAAAAVFFPSGFSISNTGLLAFQSTLDLASRLTWMNAEGKVLDELPDIAYSDPSVSPDGRSVAVSCDQLHDGKLAICVYDVGRRVTARLTKGPRDRYPVWSPDGREIAYLASDGIYRVAVDGSRPPWLVSTHGNPTSWSRDGQILFFGSQNGRLLLEVASVSDRKITEVGDGVEGQFSPDGNWIVHNGQDGIVVRRFPGPGPRIQIAGYGANQPRWSKNGRQIFYIARDKELMAVDFDPKTQTASAPRVLFPTRIVASAFIGFQFDVTSDGRFIVNSLKSTAPPLTLVTGWTAALGR